MEKELEIFYELSELFGYPGPHLFFYGAFDKFSYVMEDLMKHETFSVTLQELDFVIVTGTSKPIIFSAKKGGNLLAKETDTALITELDNSLWNELFIAAILLSRAKGQTTIFLDELLEDKNVYDKDYMITWEC